MIHRKYGGRKEFKVFSYFVFILCAAGYLYIFVSAWVGTHAVMWRDVILVSFLALVASLPFVSMDVIIDYVNGVVVRKCTWLRLNIFTFNYKLSDFDTVVVRYSSPVLGGNMESVGRSRELSHIELTGSSGGTKKKFLVDSYENDRYEAINFAEELSSYLHLPLKKQGFD
jgi:hypothetical protein